MKKIKMILKTKIKLRRKAYQAIESCSFFINPNSKVFNALSTINKKVVSPYILKIHVNNKCNLNNCEYCYLKKGDYSELKTEKIIDIIDQAKELGFRRIEILGGEPLLREDIPYLVEYAKKDKNIPQVTLFTNAILVTHSVAQKLKNAGLDKCIVGLSSLNKNGTFLNKVKGIKELVKAGIKTRILTVITSKNINQLKKINGLSKRLGIKSYYIRYFPKYKNDILFDIPFSKWKSVISWLITDKGKNYWEMILHRVRLYEGLCPGGVNVISINSRGHVTPCPFADYKLGNIYKENLQEIVCNIKKHKKFIGHPEECKKCKLLKICGGGCKASSKVIYGKYLKKDPFCKGPYKTIDLKYLPYWE